MRILLISQHLFPMQTPRSHRTTELVKELGRRGHDVTLYAVLGQHDYSDFEREFNVKVKKIPVHFQKHAYSSDADGKRTLIDKILGRLLGKALEFPAIEFMLRVSGIIVKEARFDALITIADPHHIHWGAARAKAKNPAKFPAVWIADCGDPFMINGATKDHYAYFAAPEKRFSSLCDFITVPIPEAKQGYYAEFRDKIRVIPQGFQFELGTVQKAPKNKIITFGYAGIFYKDIRNPAPFLEYLCSVTADFKFVVYTGHTELIESYRKALGDKIEVRKPIERIRLIEALGAMDFLVNIENVNSPAQIPSKLIDYSIAGRPILSVNTNALDTAVVDQFLAKDYAGQFRVKNLEQYHISTVADQFLALIAEAGNKQK